MEIDSQRKWSKLGMAAMAIIFIWIVCFLRPRSVFIMKRITIWPPILLVLLCWLSPVYASSLVPIYSLLLSDKKATNNDYRYVEICQVEENGNDITSGLVEWNLVLNQPDGGDIYWIIDNAEYKTYRFLNDDLGELSFADFAYATFQENASWKTYDSYHPIRLLESDEYQNLVDPSMSFQRTDDTSKTWQTREVVNFYHKELWTRQDVQRILYNHIENQSCVRDEPQEIVGCEFMWQAVLSYTIAGYENFPNDPYTYSGEVTFSNVVLSHDTFSTGNASKDQCWYPNEEGSTNAGGYVTLDNRINHPESKIFTESCVGTGCTVSSREVTADISLDIITEKIRVYPGVEADIGLNGILLKHAFTKRLENEHPSPADDVITIDVAFNPKPIHYSRPIKYCGYTDFLGECNMDNPAVVRVADELL
jgi:hypothetical protein